MWESLQLWDWTDIFNNDWVRGIILTLALLGLSALVFAALLVYSLRYINPPMTGLILSRSLEYFLKREPAPRIEMEWLPMEALPGHLHLILLMAEDGGFYSHKGFNWYEIKVAIDCILKDGKISRGGSTITQQCARSLFLWQGGRWTRKFLETVLTILMECFLSKQRIFELYINCIETGIGVYGLSAGCKHHFNKPINEMRTLEMIYLVALLPAPRDWFPHAPTPNYIKYQDALGGRVQTELTEIIWT